MVQDLEVFESISGPSVASISGPRLLLISKIFEFLGIA